MLTLSHLSQKGYSLLYQLISIKELLCVSINGTFDVLCSLMLLSVIEKSGNESFMLLSCLINRVLGSLLDASLKHVDALLVSVAIFSVLVFLKKVNVSSDFVSYLSALSM